MDRSHRTIFIAFVIGISLATLRATLMEESRWWNLVMAALLLLVLGLYLLREHRRTR